jgi:hypothetical protein
MSTRPVEGPKNWSRTTLRRGLTSILYVAGLSWMPSEASVFFRFSVSSLRTCHSITKNMEIISSSSKEEMREESEIEEEDERGRTDLGVELVKRLEDEVDKRPGRVHVLGRTGELSGLLVKVNVSPEAKSELVDVDRACSNRPQRKRIVRR